MSNDERKADNDNIRSLQTTLNTLNRAIAEKEKSTALVPEVSLIDKYQSQNLPDTVEDEKFSELLEQVAALQFAGNKKDQICKALSIDNKTFKDIVLDPQFQEIKKRLAEDQKTYILSQILSKVESAMTALGELVDTADEDKTRLNAVALVLEQANRLLEEQRGSAFAGAFSGVIKDAAKTGEPMTLTLAQVIMNQRRERGLNEK